MASDRREWTAIVILLLVLGASGLFLLIACTAMLGSGVTGERGVGWMFNLLVANGGAGIVGKSLLALFAVAAAYAANPDRHPTVFYAAVILCVVALISAAGCIILLGDENIASKLYNWAPSGIDEAAAFARAANIMLGGFIAWIVGVLGIQLGLKLG